MTTDKRHHPEIRQLFDDYLRMYASRDDRLTTYFSDNFSGFTGGGDFLVKDKAAWVEITRQDFAQVKDPIRIELKDVSIQSLAETVAVATGFFTIHLPIRDHILSREMARLVLIFHREEAGWKIAHSSISIPYYLVREGEVYPLQELTEHNHALEKSITDRTCQLSAANEKLQAANRELTHEMAERQQAQAALLQSEERYRSIVNASPDDITITDAEGRILMFSPAAMTLFRSKSGGDALGRSVLEFIVPEDRERALAQLGLRRQGLLSGATVYRGLRADGTTFDIEVNAEFIRDAQNLVTGIVLIIRDITERRRAEEERSRLESQNRQLQKSESLGRMAGAIAHHFNNQLQAVLMSLELAGEDLPPETELARNLTVAIRSAHKAAEVSSLMLTYLGQSNSRREPLDLTELCQRSLSLLRAGLPKTVTLEAELPVPGPRLMANADQLQQVLTNLVTNAGEACSSGTGAIRLTVRSVSAAEAGAAPNRFPLDWQPRDSAYACLEVADTGCGIAPQDFEKLFEPFFSSKFTGRGLGLPVALGIARALEGAITVESQPGRGSVFRVYLPLTAQAAAPASAPPPALATGTGRGAVLLVDDETAVRETCAMALRQLGFAVYAAENGLEAVELFERHRDEISVVVCDLSMPGMTGWEILTRLRRLAPGLPVILVSGFSETEVMAGDHPDRPQAFLHKPFDLAALKGALARSLPGRNG